MLARRKFTADLEKHEGKIRAETYRELALHITKLRELEESVSAQGVTERAMSSYLVAEFNGLHDFLLSRATSIESTRS